MLLVLVVFGVGIVRSFFTPGRTRRILMAVIGLSLPEMIILRRVLEPTLIAVFVGVVGTGTLLVGYVFNVIF
jgi:uncharacterized protein